MAPLTCIALLQLARPHLR